MQKRQTLTMSDSDSEDEEILTTLKCNKESSTQKCVRPSADCCSEHESSIDIDYENDEKNNNVNHFLSEKSRCKQKFTGISENNVSRDKAASSAQIELPTPKSREKRKVGPFITQEQADSVKTKLIDQFNSCNSNEID